MDNLASGYIIPIYSRVYSILSGGHSRERWHAHETIFSNAKDAEPTRKELKSRGIKVGKVTRITMITS